jgi:NAD(P) transhydrogenase
VRLRSGAVERVEALLAATGRDGNTAGLGLDAIGLSPTSRGHLTVHEHYRTAAPGVYAAGDVIGFPALASTSMEQARVAMVHAFDLKYKTGIASVLPFGIYTIPECSAAGETEESAQAQGIRYVAGRALYAKNARGQIIGEGDGFLKLLFRLPELTLIGVHVVGEQASELVHTGLLGLLMGATAGTFIDMSFNYPTLSDMYKYAAYDAMGARDRLTLA